MLAAIRPPEYWPRPLFFALADAADRVILGDTLQYSRQSYQNRTPIRTPQGWQWLSIPLKGGQHGRPICDVRIRSVPYWMRKHRRALHYNYRTSPFFDFYEPHLEEILQRDWRWLGDLTCSTVQLTAKLLGIETPIARASALTGRPATVSDLMRCGGGDELLSGADAAAVDASIVSGVRVLRMASLEYRQNFDGFEPGMSTLDLLFNYGPESLALIRRAARIEDQEPTSPLTSGTGTGT